MMRVTITKSTDYVVEVDSKVPLDAARLAMARFAAMSPETKELHVAEVEECYVTTGTMEGRDCQVFDTKQLTVK